MGSTQWGYRKPAPFASLCDSHLGRQQERISAAVRTRHSHLCLSEALRARPNGLDWAPAEVDESKIRTFKKKENENRLLAAYFFLAIFFTPTVQQSFASEKLLKRTCAVPEVLARKDVVEPCPSDATYPVKIENVVLHSKVCKDGKVLVKLNLKNPGDDIPDADITASVKHFGFVKKENKCGWKSSKQFKKNLDVASFQVKALHKKRQAYAVDLYLSSKSRPDATLACVHLEFSLYDFLE
ncbi:Peroxidase [Trichinella spiralis]|uniref:Peroxidase n=1 Tax=Trichinella spiralis TaxID=6334 RepID=A0ABR3KY99_TRISP